MFTNMERLMQTDTTAEGERKLAEDRVASARRVAEAEAKMHAILDKNVRPLGILSEPTQTLKDLLETDAAVRIAQFGAAAKARGDGNVD
ncbi:MAG: hypothetical protein AAB794_03970 [Patescibacteria group bacterium]